MVRKTARRALAATARRGRVHAVPLRKEPNRRGASFRVRLTNGRGHGLYPVSAHNLQEHSVVRFGAVA